MNIRYKQHINFIQLTKCVSCNEVGGCENGLFWLSSHAFCQHTAGFIQSVATLMTQIHHSLHYSIIQHLWHPLSTALCTLCDLPSVYSECILKIWNFKKKILPADKGNRCEQARKTTTGNIAMQPVLVNKKLDYSWELRTLSNIIIFTLRCEIKWIIRPRTLQCERVNKSKTL